MSEETTPEVTPDIQKTLDADSNIRKYLSGSTGTTDILGFDVKPVTLASLAFLQEAKSELVSGKPVEEISNIILEVLIFLYIQTEDHAKLARLFSKTANADQRIKEKAYGMGVDLKADQVPEILNLIVTMLTEATSTKAEPLPSEDEVVEGKKKVKQE